MQYRARVLDNAGHTRTSGVRTGAVAPPAIELEAPTHGGRVRGEVEVRAVATPDHPTYWVTFYRQVGDGARTPIGTDTSSPVYTAFDDTTGLADGSTVRYKAVLTYAPGQVVESATRGVTVVTEPVTTAVVQDRRPAGDDDQWGLHLWGDAIADGVATSWNGPDSGTTSTTSAPSTGSRSRTTPGRSTSSCTSPAAMLFRRIRCGTVPQ